MYTCLYITYLSQLNVFKCCTICLKIIINLCIGMSFFCDLCFFLLVLCFVILDTLFWVLHFTFYLLTLFLKELIFKLAHILFYSVRDIYLDLGRRSRYTQYGHGQFKGVVTMRVDTIWIIRALCFSCADHVSIHCSLVNVLKCHYLFCLKVLLNYVLLFTIDSCFCLIFVLLT